VETRDEEVDKEQPFLLLEQAAPYTIMCRYQVRGSGVVQTLTSVTFTNIAASSETVVVSPELLPHEDQDYLSDKNDTGTIKSTASFSEDSLSDQDSEEVTSGTLPIRSSLKYKTQFQSLGHSCDDNDECRENISDDKNVDFSTIEFRFYPIEMGVSPSVSSGPPLTIGWDYEGSPRRVSVMEYEAARPPRRTHHEMVLPRQTRFDWLRQEGYSRTEIQQAEKPNKIIVDTKRVPPKDPCDSISSKNVMN
jgi:hypothetical protein